MPQFSPHQDAALNAVATWLKAKPGSNGTPQVFRLFGYAGTGKTTLATHLAVDMLGEVGRERGLAGAGIAEQAEHLRGAVRAGLGLQPGGDRVERGVLMRGELRHEPRSIVHSAAELKNKI